MSKGTWVCIGISVAVVLAGFLFRDRITAVVPAL